jgi:hypothetical protein
MLMDSSASIRFLQVAFEPDDWIAVFLKSYASGRTAQRVIPVRLAQTGGIQEWLRRENGLDMNVYVSVNTVAPL